MATYRITIQGYVDCECEAHETGDIPQTHSAILEHLYDMTLSLGDIEGLQLTMRPLTPAEEAEEARKLEEKIRYAREVGDRLWAEREAGNR